MQYSYEYNGETVSVKLERQADGQMKATIGDSEYSVTASQIAGGGWLMHINSKRFLAHTASDSEAQYVHLNGTQFKLEKVENRRRRGKGSSRSGDLIAEMPGQVIDVRVKEGRSVQSGDVLLVLEAMKMEIRISAPHDGTVAKLRVKTGDVVARGQALVKISQM
ncbi:MAG: acetyl-CoA carboxylase biotin carboxyl carrier protein subunit [Anaerolineae bacterium]|nr:acetyl-CoA carboxylase biotin carboxyl carrier protein subunit [Anaerolineae bacterium]MDQ7036611.1 acetyl-CoA carboxylase biotin carboxyl carrier protein subunit [Anaerolineae bacterium]